MVVNVKHDLAKLDGLKTDVYLCRLCHKIIKDVASECTAPKDAVPIQKIVRWTANDTRPKPEPLTPEQRQEQKEKLEQRKVKQAAELAEAESHYTETIEPTLPQRVAHYATALRKWRAAGYPTRTDAEVAACLAKCEEPCPKWDAVKTRCKVCGCNVNASGFAVANKARMATEVCPLGRWPERGIITPEEPTP